MATMRTGGVISFSLIDGVCREMKMGIYYCGMETEKPPILSDAGDKPSPVVAPLPDEYDRRGVKLPARARVGGIIIPQ
jgi:hypothetical protein